MKTFTALIATALATTFAASAFAAEAPAAKPETMPAVPAHVVTKKPTHHAHRHVHAKDAAKPATAK